MTLLGPLATDETVEASGPFFVRTKYVGWALRDQHPGGTASQPDSNSVFAFPRM